MGEVTLFMQYCTCQLQSEQKLKKILKELGSNLKMKIINIFIQSNFIFKKINSLFNPSKGKIRKIKSPFAPFTVHPLLLKCNR